MELLSSIATTVKQGRPNGRAWIPNPSIGFLVRYAYLSLSSLAVGMEGKSDQVI